MRLKYYGHASFLITSQEGVRIITDPYEPGCFSGGISYGKITDKADIVLVSHDHADHNYVKGIAGSPTIVKEKGRKNVKGIEFIGISTFHDGSKGRERGDNTIYIFTVDGIRISHLGDLGHPIGKDMAQEIGPVDLLLIPVGGFFTIDPKEATEVIRTINPKVVVPMHFKTPSCGFPIAYVSEFIKDKERVRELKESEIELSVDNLPQRLEIIILRPSL